MILVLISPRHAALPFAAWLPEEAGRLVAVCAAGARAPDGIAETITVADYTDDAAVLAAARRLHARHPVRAVLALAEVDVERAARLRVEFGLPGLDPVAAVAYRDKVAMKEYARAGGLRVPRFAAVSRAADVADFMRANPGRVVVKPRGGSGSTGVVVLSRPADAAALDPALRATPHQVEEYIDGPVYHVDAIRVDGDRLAAVASAYTGHGCLSHLSDLAFGSYTLNPGDDLHDRLVSEVWRLVDALPSPPSIVVHAEFFVTGAGDVVLCEVAARVAGGPIPLMLRQRLGIDPRELWSRIECGLPVDLDGIRAHLARAPLAGFGGVPPRAAVVTRVPGAPAGAVEFHLATRVGDDWRGDRYHRRKSADLLAAWVVTAADERELITRLERTTTQMSAAFGWSVDEPAVAA
jgi:hypothetical protein